MNRKVIFASLGTLALGGILGAVFAAHIWRAFGVIYLVVPDVPKPEILGFQPCEPMEGILKINVDLNEDEFWTCNDVAVALYDTDDDEPDDPEGFWLGQTTDIEVSHDCSAKKVKIWAKYQLMEDQVTAGVGDFAP